MGAAQPGRPPSAVVWHGRQREVPGCRRPRIVTNQCRGVRPVGHEEHLAVLKREPRLLLLPREDRGRNNLQLLDATAHERKRAHRSWRVYDDPPLVIENAAPEAD